MQQAYQNVMAILHYFIRPQMFITATANPKFCFLYED
jgi:hypothetical protein